MDVPFFVGLEEELALFGKIHNLKALSGTRTCNGRQERDSNSRRSGEKQASPCATKRKLALFGKIHKFSASLGLRWLKGHSPHISVGVRADLGFRGMRARDVVEGRGKKNGRER